MTDLLKVRDLKISFLLPEGQLDAVKGVDFDLRTGGTLALVGESGSGKSVISQAIMGILPKTAKITSGQILFDDPAADGVVDIAKLRPNSLEMRDIRGGRISIIFQEPMTSLSPVHTVGNQIGEALHLHRDIGEAEGQEVMVEMLRMVGFPDPVKALQTYPFELSGGLRQRAMIAMALICRPALLIADEPTTALDVTIQAQILLLLAELQREFGMALMLITHDLGIVARVADRVAVMYAGQIVEQGTVEEVFETPLHPYTRGLLSCIPIPGKTKRGSHLGSIPGIVPSMIGDIQGCHFRDRCPFAWADCAAGPVQLSPIGEGRAYRCLLSPEEAASKAVAAEVAE